MAGDKYRLGMMLFIASEAVFFTVLILAFVFYRDSPAAAHGPNDFNALDVGRTAIFTVCLYASSFTIILSERSHKKGRDFLMKAWLLLTIGLGATFLYGESSEYIDVTSRLGLTPHRDIFGTTFFALTGFHGFHVLIGLVAGWLASALMHSRHGIVVDLLLGLVGSLLGGLVVRAIMQAHGPFADANVEKVRVASQTLTRTSWSVMSHIVVAVLGAVVAPMSLVANAQTAPIQQQRFTVSFYLTAMLFILFDIEIVFLYPLAVILHELAWFGFLEFLFFIVILVIAYVYIWRKGALDWQ